MTAGRLADQSAAAFADRRSRRNYWGTAGRPLDLPHGQRLRRVAPPARRSDNRGLRRSSAPWPHPSLSLLPSEVSSANRTTMTRFTPRTAATASAADHTAKLPRPLAARAWPVFGLLLDNAGDLRVNIIPHHARQASHRPFVVAHDQHFRAGRDRSAVHRASRHSGEV